MKENVTTPAEREAIASMLGNPEAFSVCVCVCAFNLHQMCIVCAHVYLVKNPQCHIVLLHSGPCQQSRLQG